MMSRLSRFALCLALLAFAGAGFAADWPQWRGPARDGVSRETGLLKKWPKGGPKLLWENPLGAGASSFAVVGDRLYTMYQNRERQYGVCLDANTGKKVWEYGMGKPFAKVATGPRATPTVDGERVYFQDAWGNLACVQAADGKEIWTVDTMKLAGSKPINWQVANSPFISGELLVINPGVDPKNRQGASVMALDKKTGKVIWKSGADVAGYSTPVEMKVGGVDSFVLLTGENVIGVAAKDGAQLWSYAWPNRTKINVPQVIVDGDKVFATTGYGVGCVMLQIASEGGKFTAKEVWPMSKAMRCRYGNPVMVDGYIYGFDDRTLTCIDPKTGQSSWKQDGFGYGALSYADGLFYLFGEKGNLALARLTPARCEVISEVSLLPGKEARWATPTVAGGKLYVRDDQKVVCLDVKAK